MSGSRRLTPEERDAATHRLERCGLGKAPYKFLGHGTEVYQAVPGDPSCPLQPGAACDCCGAGIYEVFRFRSADGNTFKLGSTCFFKAFEAVDKRDPAVVAATKAIRKVEREKKAARDTAKIDAALAKLPEVAATLRSKPHPHEWRAKQGATLLEWAEWMLAHAGTRGRLEVAKVINRESAALSTSAEAR